ncbi:MAG: type II methionyl aminopeptidase [Candidatus Micrarchaeota archaeon]|nr:type II methionyl aminopeptidase [Candidatus Micrarchaeota archaeon]
MGIYEEIREELEKLVIPEMPLIDIAETIEDHIRNAGYYPAFPVNISINEIAAHYTPPPQDETVIKEDDLVKIDFGYHNGDGKVIDNAITIDLSESHKPLLEAAEKSVKEAISHIQPGKKVNEISQVIYEVVQSYGLKPIANLTGHSIEPYWIHGGVPLPSVPNEVDYEFKEGDRFAVEVFVTYPEGSGYVVDSGEPHIFSLISLERGIRTHMGRKLLLHIVKEYKTLPFSDRWLVKKFGSKFMVKTGLMELRKAHLIEAYPPLREEKRTPIAQFELTVELTSEGAQVVK